MEDKMSRIISRVIFIGTICLTATQVVEARQPMIGDELVPYRERTREPNVTYVPCPVPQVPVPAGTPPLEGPLVVQRIAQCVVRDGNVEIDIQNMRRAGGFEIPFGAVEIKTLPLEWNHDEVRHTSTIVRVPTLTLNGKEESVRLTDPDMFPRYHRLIKQEDQKDQSIIQFQKPDGGIYERPYPHQSREVSRENDDTAHCVHVKTQPFIKLENGKERDAGPVRVVDEPHKQEFKIIGTMRYRAPGQTQILYKRPDGTTYDGAVYKNIPKHVSWERDGTRHRSFPVLEYYIDLDGVQQKVADARVEQILPKRHEVKKYEKVDETHTRVTLKQPTGKSRDDYDLVLETLRRIVSWQHDEVQHKSYPLAEYYVDLEGRRQIVDAAKVEPTAVETHKILKQENQKDKTIIQYQKPDGGTYEKSYPHQLREVSRVHDDEHHVTHVKKQPFIKLEDGKERDAGPEKVDDETHKQDFKVAGTVSYKTPGQTQVLYTRSDGTTYNGILCPNKPKHVGWERDGTKHQSFPIIEYFIDMEGGEKKVVEALVDKTSFAPKLHTFSELTKIDKTRTRVTLKQPTSRGWEDYTVVLENKEEIVGHHYDDALHETRDEYRKYVTIPDIKEEYWVSDPYLGGTSRYYKIVSKAVGKGETVVTFDRGGTSPIFTEKVKHYICAKDWQHDKEHHQSSRSVMEYIITPDPDPASEIMMTVVPWHDEVQKDALVSTSREVEVPGSRRQAGAQETWILRKTEVWKPVDGVEYTTAVDRQASRAIQVSRPPRIAAYVPPPPAPVCGGHPHSHYLRGSDGNWYRIGNMESTFYHTGHCPGSITEDDHRWYEQTYLSRSIMMTKIIRP